MRVFIRRKAMEVLIGCARVVKLVKVHAVQVRRRFRNLIRLIHKECRIPLCGSGDIIALRIKERDLVEPYRSICHRKGNARCCARNAVCDLLPAEHVPIFFSIEIYHAVIRRERNASGIETAKHADFRNLGRLAEFNPYRFARLPVPCGFRRGRRAKVDERHDRINRRERNAIDLVTLCEMKLCVLRFRQLRLWFRPPLRFFRERRVLAPADQDIKTGVCKVGKAAKVQEGTHDRHDVIRQPARVLMRHNDDRHQAVEQQRTAKPRKGNKDAPVTVGNECDKQQKQRREQIALVHILAKHEKRRKAERERERQSMRLPLTPLQIQERRKHNRQADEDRPPGFVGEQEQRIVYVHPVSAKERKQVERFDARIRIRSRCAEELIQKPERFLPAAERQRKHEQRRNGGSDGSYSPKQPFPPRILYIRKIRDGKERPRHERLRFHKDRDPVNKPGKDHFLLQEQEYHREQQERQDLIDLPPTAGNESHDRIKCHERRKHERQAAVSLGLSGRTRPRPCGHFVNQICRTKIRKDGRHLRKQHITGAAVTEAEPFCDAARQPEDIHVSRRIIREHARGVKPAEPTVCKGIRPCHKAGDIRGMPIDHNGQQAAHKKRSHKDAAQRKALMRCRAKQRIRPHDITAIEEQHQACRKEQRHAGLRKVRDLPCHLFGLRFAFNGSHGKIRCVARKIRKIFNRHIIKPGAACGFRAIAADAEANGQLCLFLSGLADKFHSLPVVRPINAARCSKRAHNGNVGSCAAFHAFRPHTACKPVVGLCLYFNRLAEAHIVARAPKVRRAAVIRGAYGIAHGWVFIPRLVEPPLRQLRAFGSRFEPAVFRQISVPFRQRLRRVHKKCSRKDAGE